MKVIGSDISELERESRILRHIREVAPADGAKYVSQPLDQFEHPGPNGIHTCLVFEPMGPRVNEMAHLELSRTRKTHMSERFPPWKVDKAPKFVDTHRCPAWMAKRILKQCLQALAFLNENGIGLGGLQLSNLRFALDEDIDTKPEDVLWQDENTNSSPVPLGQNLDGKCVPRCLYHNQPLVSFVNLDGDFKIKLGSTKSG